MKKKMKKVALNTRPVPSMTRQRISESEDNRSLI